MINDNWATSLAKAILAEDGPEIVQASKLDTPYNLDERIFVVARHSTVDRILRHPDLFSLANYDNMLDQIADDTRFFVGQPSPSLAERHKMLFAAQSLIAKRIESGAPPSDVAYRDWISLVAHEKAQLVLKILRSSRSAETPINLVREYGYLVTHLTAREIFGLKGPRRPTLLAKLFMLGRNLIVPGRWVSMRGELGIASAMFAYIHLVFAHAFGNLNNNRVLRFVAKWAARDYCSAIDHAMAHADQLPPNSLLAALLAVRGDFAAEMPDDEHYHHQVRAITFELVGAMTLLIGKAFADIADLLVGNSDVRQSNVTWADFVARLEATPRHSDASFLLLDEALRLAGGTRLIRIVTRDMMMGDVELRSGDRIFLLVDYAGFDTRVFPNPGKFDPKPARKGKYLTFGPVGGPHACYGQPIARTILREMILAADRYLEPANDSVQTLFALMPDDMDWRLKQMRTTTAVATGENAQQMADGFAPKPIGAKSQRPANVPIGLDPNVPVPLDKNPEEI